MSDSKIWPEGAGQLNLRQGHIDHRDKTLDITQRLRFLVGEGVGQDAAREIDTLRAKIDACREEVEALKFRAADSYSNLMQVCEWHCNRAEKAESALAECREDAERYRWLRDDAVHFTNSDRTPSPYVVFGTSHDDAEPHWDEDLDAAIDAARAK